MHITRVIINNTLMRYIDIMHVLLIKAKNNAISV